MLIALGEWHSSNQRCLVFAEIKMPLLLLHRVMHRTPLAAFGTGKAGARLKIEPKTQVASLDIHLAVDNFSLPAARCVGNFQCFRVAAHFRAEKLSIIIRCVLPFD
jgi:hypothetical protein